MSIPVFKFSEIVEVTYLGDNKIRWDEIAQIRAVDDVIAPIEAEYRLVTEYYDPVSTLLIDKGNGGDSQEDAASLTFTGGFNTGDTISIDVGINGGTPTPITMVVQQVLTADDAATIFAEQIAVTFLEVVSLPSGISPNILVWSMVAGKTVELTNSIVTRSIIPLPEAVNDFLLAVKDLD